MVERGLGINHIEIMVTIFIMSIAFLGLLISRYNATVGAHKADKYATGARTGLAFLENWRADGGVVTHNPADMHPCTPSEGRDQPAGFTRLNGTSYSIPVDGLNYFITLSYLDYPDTNLELFGLRALNVTVAWDSRTGILEPYSAKVNKVFVMSTFSEI